MLVLGLGNFDDGVLTTCLSDVFDAGSECAEEVDKTNIVGFGKEFGFEVSGGDNQTEADEKSVDGS